MSDAEQLTAKERKTLNEAMAIIQAHTPKGASWMVCLGNYHGTFSFDVTYWTSKLHTQHSWCRGATFADRVQDGMERDAAEVRDPEPAKLAKIERLRKELAELTDEAQPEPVS